MAGCGLPVGCLGFWWLLGACLSSATLVKDSLSLSLSPSIHHCQTTPLSLSPSIIPFLSLSIGRLQPLSSEDTCLSTYSSQSDSQYGSPPRGWSEEMDEHGHMLYVSDYTNEKVPACRAPSALSLLWWLLGRLVDKDILGMINGSISYLSAHL